MQATKGKKIYVCGTHTYTLYICVQQQIWNNLINQLKIVVNNFSYHNKIRHKWVIVKFYWVKHRERERDEEKNKATGKSFNDMKTKIHN